MNKKIDKLKSFFRNRNNFNWHVVIIIFFFLVYKPLGFILLSLSGVLYIFLLVADRLKKGKITFSTIPGMGILRMPITKIVYKRNKQPIRFWFSIVFYLFLAGVFLYGFIKFIIFFSKIK